MSRNTNRDSNVVSESPLIAIDFASIGLSSDVLRIVEDPFLKHINIRGNAGDTAFMQAVESVLGVALPTSANTAVIESALTILWYGPSEWLVLCGNESDDTLLNQLRSALEGMHSLVTDISGGNTVIDISGEKSRDLLKKATTIDVHTRACATGDCALTIFAHASAALYQYDGAPSFRVVVRRSCADYIGTWLIDAAREYKI